jgi:hypothetical protein
MKNRLNAMQVSARATLVAGFCFACSQTPAPEAPVQPAPEPAAAPAAAEEKAPAAPIVIKDVGFATPESVLYEPTSDTYLVSNINGTPLDKDDNGFISKLSPEGKVLELKWIDAAQAGVDLNAPKGLGISNGKLYVTDIDVVRSFDLATGKPAATIKIDGSSFLNDIAVAPDGTVYVSDTGLKGGKDGGLEPAKKDAIYKIDAAGKVSTLIKGEQLKNPNGLYADDKGLWVATWQGGIYRVTPDGKQEATVTVPGAQLDGLFHTPDGQTIVSSWEKSMVYLGTADGQFSPLVADLKSPADLGYDTKRGQLLVPLFMDNAVQIQALPQVSATAQTQAPATNATAEAK